MMDAASAYDARAAEYAALFGKVAASAREDRDRIGTWADDVRGPALDLGCGPGHWTDLLHRRAAGPVVGVDPAPAFLDLARVAFPGVAFRAGGWADLAPDGTLGGVLAWYSLIHVPPADLPAALAAVAAALRPGGTLLLGAFDGAPGEPFDHAVTTAWTWSVPALTDLLARAGLEVTDARTRTDPGARPHLDLVAERV